MQNAFSSDDESTLDVLPQPSSSNSVYSSTSHPSSYVTGEEGNFFPKSIFVDDTNIMTSRNHVNDATQEVVNLYEEDDSPITDIQNIDELLNCDHRASDDEVDDISLHSSESSFDGNEIDAESNSHHFVNDRYHRFNEMTHAEAASYKIMSLLDTAGAPRGCYDRLIALLKKLSKKGFDVRKAINRDTLMQRLGKYKARPRIQMSVIKKQEVFRFMFQDMLQDLLHSCSKHLQYITPNATPATNVQTGTEHELWNTPWMRNTFATAQYKNFDSKNDIMLPIILYMDKTGTDVNQRYSLEPVLFSLAALPLEQRESRHSWRHLGFIPGKDSSFEDELSTSLQFYHDCLSYLLDGLREAQKNPPTVTITLPHGDMIQRKAMLPLMVVMGDQLSQDTLCGRLKSNSGGAGRVHRNCMCSYLNIDDPYHECKKVNQSTLDLLTKYARISDEEIDSMISSHGKTKDSRLKKSFLLKQRTMFRGILRHPYTTHSIKNAFTGVDFGSWSAGIHDATFDDFMHSVEAGMVAYITETVYNGLTKKEREAVEEITRPLLTGHRCSIISTYPRWRLQPGFTRQTLMTSGERVGSVLALSLSLQDPTVSEIIQQGHNRQIGKYLDLSTAPKTEDDTMTKKPPPAPLPHPEFYLDQHMDRLDDPSIKHTLEQMARHGFHLALIDELDHFQINQMISECADIFKTTKYPHNYPSEDIVGSYTDIGSLFNLPKEQFKKVKYAMQTEPSKMLSSHQRRKIEGVTGKHFKKKAHKKGEGSSAAVLSSKIGTLNMFLEYVLCYHAFCKYSWTLPVFLQRNYMNIKAGNRFVVEYFQKLIYRGNTSIDSRFPKIHAQCRMSGNTEALNTVMNFSCETGERLLKTEAKGISRTAQQRGNTTFLSQTMSRLQDRSVLDCFAMYLEEKETHDEPLESNQTDRFARTFPHFIYDIEKEQIFSVNRKNERTQQNSKSGFLSKEVLDALKKHEPQMKQFEIYNEVVLRNDSRVRASPNYAKSGPWYDYANVSWEITNDAGVVETCILPAKCLCFFRTVSQRDILALVHTVDKLSVGKIPGRTDTLLTRHYLMQYDNKGVPVTHVVPIASIDSSIRCFQHHPSDRLFDYTSPGITYLIPRNHWAYLWMALNESLMESNSEEKVKQRKGKLISLCNQQWLESVRQRHSTYLHATCIEEI